MSERQSGSEILIGDVGFVLHHTTGQQTTVYVNPTHPHQQTCPEILTERTQLNLTSKTVPKIDQKWFKEDKINYILKIMYIIDV